MCVWSVNFVASLTENECSRVLAFPICRVRKIAASLGQKEGFWYKALDTVHATGPDGETYIRGGNILNTSICVHRSILQVVFSLHVKTMPASNTPAHSPPAGSPDLGGEDREGYSPSPEDVAGGDEPSSLELAMEEEEAPVARLPVRLPGRNTRPLSDTDQDDAEEEEPQPAQQFDDDVESSDDDAPAKQAAPESSEDGEATEDEVEEVQKPKTVAASPGVVVQTAAEQRSAQSAQRAKEVAAEKLVKHQQKVSQDKTISDFTAMAEHSRVQHKERMAIRKGNHLQSRKTADDTEKARAEAHRASQLAAREEYDAGSKGLTEAFNERQAKNLAAHKAELAQKKAAWASVRNAAVSKQLRVELGSTGAMFSPIHKSKPKGKDKGARGISYKMQFRGGRSPLSKSDRAKVGRKPFVREGSVFKDRLDKLKELSMSKEEFERAALEMQRSSREMEDAEAESISSVVALNKAKKELKDLQDVQQKGRDLRDAQQKAEASRAEKKAKILAIQREKDAKKQGVEERKEEKRIAKEEKESAKKLAAFQAKKKNLKGAEDRRAKAALKDGKGKEPMVDSSKAPKARKPSKGKGEPRGKKHV